jgi:hypothetical protein
MLSLSAIVIRNEQPLSPAKSINSTSPPNFRASLRDNAKPRPVPPNFRVAVLDAGLGTSSRKLCSVSEATTIGIGLYLADN